MKITYLKDGILVGDAFLLLSEIVEECNKVAIKEDNIVLLEMGWDGRAGSVFEQIALSKEKALRLKEILLDKNVYFGEIWGKHSEVYGDMSEDTFEIVEDSKKIKKFLSTYPDKHNYDHSFIYTLIERSEEYLEYDEEESELTQQEIDEIYELIK